MKRQVLSFSIDADEKQDIAKEVAYELDDWDGPMENGFHTGTFKVTIEWSDEHE